VARRRQLLLGLVGGLLGGIVLGVLAGPASARPERPAPVGSDPFRPGTDYRGDFPDPTVWRVGGRFYAASTTIAALNLPVTTSTDLVHWTARPAPDPAQPWLSDAMPEAARWAQRKISAGGRPFGATWAPSVARIGTGTATRYVAAYSVIRARDGRRCLSLARSLSPFGPYIDSTSRPLACGPRGAIDPQLYVEGRAIWMFLKLQGPPDRILVRRMNSRATGFAARSRAYALLAPRAAWEGSVVENPAMIRYRGRRYLFYSGNAYASSRYATGYAVCSSVVGPCRRVARILASSSSLAGPGGATPFVDLGGRLRLAYHAWRTGHVGYPATDACLTSTAGCAQRRMYVATLAASSTGRLVLRDRS
jgi:hypothetical protein